MGYDILLFIIFRGFFRCFCGFYTPQCATTWEEDQEKVFTALGSFTLQVMIVEIAGTVKCPLILFVCLLAFVAALLFSLPRAVTQAICLFALFVSFYCFNMFLIVNYQLYICTMYKCSDAIYTSIFHIDSLCSLREYYIMKIWFTIV